MMHGQKNIKLLHSNSYTSCRISWKSANHA